MVLVPLQPVPAQGPAPVLDRVRTEHLEPQPILPLPWPQWHGMALMLACHQAALDTLAVPPECLLARRERSPPEPLPLTPVEQECHLASDRPVQFPEPEPQRWPCHPARHTQGLSPALAVLLDQEAPWVQPG